MTSDVTAHSIILPHNMIISNCHVEKKVNWSQKLLFLTYLRSHLLSQEQVLSFSHAKGPWGFAWKRMLNLWWWNFWMERRESLSARFGAWLESQGGEPQGGELGRVQLHQHWQAIDLKGCYMWFVEILISLLYSWFRAESQTGLVSWSCHSRTVWLKAK